MNARQLRKRLRKRWKVFIVTDKNDLRYSWIKSINPRYIFFPHWSWFIPEKIYKYFPCIIFHMTDLPFGRGGNPLQNLIERGIIKTKISAIRAVDSLDAGPIYLKKRMPLHGSAEQVYKRASDIIFNEMIPYIIKNSPTAIPQQGKVVIFKRRQPQESRIPDDIIFNRIYDFIRMLDAEGYPPAFLELKNMKMEFRKAEKKNSYIHAEVSIGRKGKNA